MPKHTAFISHAHADNALCDPYAAGLKKLGIDVWYDRTNMDASQLMSDTIARELERRTALIVMLTPNAIKSKWVKLEIGAFISYWAKIDAEERVIIPVLLTECEVPPILRAFKYVDATLLGQDDAIAAIARILGVEPPKAPLLPAYPSWEGYARDITETRYPQVEQMLGDWLAFVEEKWRAISDAQLGWKPLRGRYASWDEIYADVSSPKESDNDPHESFLERRFENAKVKAPAAAAVVSFLHDLEALRQALADASTRDETPPSQRTGKSPIIRNPMFADADDADDGWDL